MIMIRPIVALSLSVGTVLQLTLALPNGRSSYCASPTSTSTKIEPHFQCLHQACIRPESVCRNGEPTGKPPTPPRTATVTSPNHCTAIVEIQSSDDCGQCPTCVSANPGGPVVTARQTYNNPGGPMMTETINPGGPIITEVVNPGGPIITGRIIPAYGCSTMTTVSTTVSAPAPICNCPLLLATCPEGQTTAVQALPTFTVTEGCLVSIVAGPGCLCPICI